MSNFDVFDRCGFHCSSGFSIVSHSSISSGSNVGKVDVNVRTGVSVVLRVDSASLLPCIVVVGGIVVSGSSVGFGGKSCSSFVPTHSMYAS